MKIDNEGLRHIRSFIDDPSDTKAKSGLGLLYWSSLIDSLCDLIVEGTDTNNFIQEQRAFIDVGVFPKISGDAISAIKAIYDSKLDYKHLNILSFTGLIESLIKKIYAGDKKETLEREIKSAGIKKGRTQSQLIEAQDRRVTLLKTELASNIDPKQAALIEALANIDNEVLNNLKIKRSIARGKFLDVDSKRKFVADSQAIEEKRKFVDALYSNLKDLKAKASLREILKSVEKLQASFLDYEDAINKKTDELEQVNRESSEISPMEVESKLRKELEFIRDNVKLSAKRVKQDNFGTYVPSQKYFTVSKVKECLDVILEFDPHIFHNDRVNVFGKPSILLIPGNGNGIYDWKNNMLVIPLSPYGGDFMVSIASAVIEYRLDVDEDKKLISQYQKLPKMKTVKSIIALKDSLTKDYIKWVTSEYQGFKVLEKEHRQWFEHEIAPSKLEIYCPPELQMFAMTLEESQELLKNFNEDIEKGNNKSAALWGASILTYQSGDYQKSYSLIKEASELDGSEKFLFYNLGIISMKASRKQEAIDAFNKYATDNSQGWWTSVARDHVRRLQMG